MNRPHFRKSKTPQWVWGSVACLASGLAATPVFAEGDPKRGETVYKKCKVCHLIDQEKNRVGPHLVGVFGRKAGSLEGFRYSKALKASEVVWTEETIDAYIAAPRKFIKGGRMAFPGLKKPEDRRDVIAYMKGAGG